MDEAHGKKISAGMRLTKYLDEIGLEESEVRPGTGSPGVMPVFVTKAEMLAREIWKAALGYEEEKRVKDPETGDMVIRKVTIKPDHKYVSMLYDRLVGKAAATDNTSGPKKQPKSSDVEEQADRRIKDLAKET